MKRQLILLHGALGASVQLNPLAERSIAENCQVFTFSFSGHGKEAFQEEFGIEQFSRELQQFISLNNLTSPDVFGYSMGGYVALYTAAKNPGLMGRITTLGTKFKWDKETAAKEVKNLDPVLIEQKVPKFAIRLKEMHGENWIQLLNRTAEMMIRMGEKSPLSDKDLSSIQNKVSIGLADQDKMVSVEETDRVATLIKNSSRYTLFNTSHPIETADPSILVKQLLLD